MAAWEDTLRSLGDDGEALAKEFKTLAQQIRKDMSSFLQSEAERVKKLLAQRANGEIRDNVLILLLKNEKLFVQQHLALIQAQVEEQVEQKVTDGLLKAIIKIIALL